MSDQTRELYVKVNVVRMDGQGAAGQKHFGCEYFVLDLTHDEFAAAAILAYANACLTKYPLLASDLLSGLSARAEIEGRKTDERKAAK